MLQVSGNQTMYRKHIDIFIGYLFIFCFLALVSLFAAFAKDEGQVSAHGLLAFLADRFHWIFPLTLLSTTFEKTSYLIIFMMLLMVNVVLYSFLFSYISGKFIFKIYRYKPFDFTFYSSLFVL